MPAPAGTAVPEDASALCQACGACCAYSSDWPRFSLESEAALARIPEDLIAPSRGGMRCEGDRCAALDGLVGIATGCRIYDDRPAVCRDCSPGDDACRIARQHHGLPPLQLPANQGFAVRAGGETKE